MGHSNKQQRVLSVLCSSESDSESDSRVPTVTSINCIFDRITCFSITTVKINRMLILDSLKQCGSGYNRGRKFLPRSSLYFNWSWSVGEGWMVHREPIVRVRISPWDSDQGENFGTKSEEKTRNSRTRNWIGWLIRVHFVSELDYKDSLR